MLETLAGWLTPEWLVAQVSGPQFWIWTALCLVSGFAFGRSFQKRVSDGVIAELGRRPTREELDLAERNANDALAEDGTDLEAVRLRQSVLDRLARAGTPERVAALARELVSGSVDANLTYGPALADLERYDCVAGLRVGRGDLGDGDYRVSPGRPVVLRERYPGLAERRAIDAVRRHERWREVDEGNELAGDPHETAARREAGRIPL